MREHEWSQVAEVDVRNRLQEIPYFIAMLARTPSWLLKAFQDRRL